MHWSTLSLLSSLLSSSYTREEYGNLYSDATYIVTLELSKMFFQLYSQPGSESQRRYVTFRRRNNHNGIEKSGGQILPLWVLSILCRI